MKANVFADRSRSLSFWTNVLNSIQLGLALTLSRKSLVSLFCFRSNIVFANVASTGSSLMLNTSTTVSEISGRKGFNLIITINCFQYRFTMININHKYDHLKNPVWEIVDMQLFLSQISFHNLKCHGAKVRGTKISAALFVQAALFVNLQRKHPPPRIKTLNKEIHRDPFVLFKTICFRHPCSQNRP